MGDRPRDHLARAFAVEGTYSKGMTGDPATGVIKRYGKDVPQFAANFSVYLLPPDVVCLYSEDRKFLLHGALYCAVASAMSSFDKRERVK